MTNPFNKILYLFLLLICGLTASICSSNTTNLDTPQSTQTQSTPAAHDFHKFSLVITGAKRREIPRIISEIEAAYGTQMLSFFEHYLEGQIYYWKADRNLVIVEKSNEGSLESFDFTTGASLGLTTTKAVKKLPSNNKIRKHLRATIARLQLSHSNPDIRLAAVDTLFKNLTTENIEILESRLESETHDNVREKISVALAIDKLRQGHSHETQLSAIEQLSTSLDPAAKNALNDILKSSTNTANEESLLLVNSAQQALNTINQKIRFYEILEQLFFGLSLGSVLFLAAIGLAITFGVMGVINMAHGEMMMLGAYTTFVVQQAMPNQIAYSLWIAIPCAFLVSGSVGILIERGIIRFLQGRPLETLLATFGVSLILQQSVRTVFSPLNQPVITPDWMSGSLQFNPIFSLTYNRLYIFIFAIAVFLLLQFILKRTSLGLKVRAVSQNRDMAKAMGIRTSWVDALTFGLGSGIAGIAGVALSQLTNVGPNLGQTYIVDAFMVVVFGGVGNLMGTLVGGFSLGVGNKLLEPNTGAVLANILILCFIVFFIQRQPKGLFPQKGRAAE